MLIIYGSSQPSLGMLACRLHLAQESASQRISHSVSEEWNWCSQPLREIGRDAAGNLICCLFYGRHGAMYGRAIRGIDALFSVNASFIDVDHLPAKNVLSFQQRLAWWFFLRFPVVRNVLQHNIAIPLQEYIVKSR